MILGNNDCSICIANKPPSFSQEHPMNNPLDVHVSFLLGLQESSGQESSKPELGLCYYVVCPPCILDESPCLLDERFRRLFCGQLRKIVLFHHVSLLTYQLQLLFHAHPHLPPLLLRPLVLFLAQSLPRGRGLVGCLRNFSLYYRMC